MRQDETERSWTQRNQAGPSATKRDEAEPSWTKRNQARRSGTKLDQAEPSRTKRNQAEPSWTKRNQARRSLDESTVNGSPPAQLALISFSIDVPTSLTDVPTSTLSLDSQSNKNPNRSGFSGTVTEGTHDLRVHSFSRLTAQPTRGSTSPPLNSLTPCLTGQSSPLQRSYRHPPDQAAGHQATPAGDDSQLWLADWMTSGPASGPRLPSSPTLTACPRWLLLPPSCCAFGGK